MSRWFRTSRARDGCASRIRAPLPGPHPHGPPGHIRLAVRPFHAAGGKWQMSAAGGGSPHWRRDGKGLFYLGPESRRVAAPVTLSERGLEAGTAKPLFQNTNMQLPSISVPTAFRVSADG
jgi:hypothetical protein